MRLFLSSIRLPNAQERLKLFGDKKPVSVTVIPDAWDAYPESRQSAEIAQTISDFEENGYTPTVLNLATSTDAQRKEALSSADFIWFTGGNSFLLNYRVKMTGFDVLLKEALANGTVFGGASAGAILACPTLHGVENADDSHDAPEIMWDGIGLVDFGVVPHWGMEKYASKLQKMADDMRPYVPQIITLTNDQAVVCIDGHIEVNDLGV